MPVTRARHIAPATNRPIASSTAEQVLSTLEELSKNRYVCPYEMATARAALGQHDAAFSWLRRAVDDRSVCIPDLKTDPRLDALRHDPRFQALLKEVGFTP